MNRFPIKKIVKLANQIDAFTFKVTSTCKKHAPMYVYLCAYIKVLDPTNLQKIDQIAVNFCIEGPLLSNFNTGAFNSICQQNNV